MLKKLKTKRGETLIETMVALAVIVVIISMLPMAIVTAAKVNKQASEIATICTKQNPTASAVSVTLSIDSSTVRSTATITESAKQIDSTISGYTEDGFVYYTAG